MGLIFISHSSRNNARAIEMRNWLRDHGWRDVFLDLDPTSGLAPGQRWQDELKTAGERCSAVIVLISRAWLKAEWCRTEFRVASQLGKRIFGVIVAETGRARLLDEIRAKYQLVDVSDPARAADGFKRLRVGLTRAGLDPAGFHWPPPDQSDRQAYRGLRTLDEQDAAVFFGRDGAITRGLDTLRRMRDGAPERMLVVLGASGAGKSSFLRAGLLARLRRDEEHFLVLPTVRPERLALTGPHGLHHALDGPIDPAPQAVKARLNAIRKPVVARLRRFARAARDVHRAKPPTLVLPIDQAEELFAADNTERHAALDFLRTALDVDPNLIVVVTIRSDGYAQLQAETRLADVPRCPFDLPPMPLAAFKDVIEGPGRLSPQPIAFEPELTDRLVADLDRPDALPLLALTLERLVARRRADGRITLADYEEGLHGLEGAIGYAVDAAFAAAAADPALPSDRAALEALARRAFIPWLVRLDDVDGVPKRRVADLREIPIEARDLVGHFVDQRLLLSDARDAATSVEVSHEAVLRRWTALREWIDDERRQLRAVESVRTAAAEWRRRGSSPDAQSETWLVHRGVRLAEALQLIERPDYAPILTEEQRAYLTACSDRQVREQEESKRHAREREARAMAALARTTLPQRPQRALLLAVEAMERIGRQGGHVAEVDEALAAIVGAVRGQPVPVITALDEKPGLDAFSLSPDGGHLARLRAADVLVWPLDAAGVAGDAMTYEIPKLGAYPRIRWLGVRDLVVDGEADGNPLLLVLRVTGERTLVERGRERGRSIGAAPDGSVLVVRLANQATEVVVVSGDALQRIARLPPHRSAGEVVFSPDGSRFVTCDPDGGAVYRVERAGDAVAALLHVRVNANATYRFSPDNRWLFCANTTPWEGHSGADAWICDLSVPAPAASARSLSSRNVAIAEFSPDSRWLAFVGWNDAYQDEHVQLYRLGETANAPNLLQQIEEINYVAFSADSHWVVSASRFDDNAFAWDLHVLGSVAPECGDRALRAIPLGGHGRGIGFVSFVGTATTVVTRTDAGIFRQFELEKQTAEHGRRLDIWRLAPSSPQTFLGHDGPIAKSIVSANEQTMLTVAKGETPRLWRLPARAAVLPPDVVAEARRLAARAPTEEERAAFELR